MNDFISKLSLSVRMIYLTPSGLPGTSARDTFLHRFLACTPALPWQQVGPGYFGPACHHVSFLLYAGLFTGSTWTPHAPPP